MLAIYRDVNIYKYVIYVMKFRDTFCKIHAVVHLLNLIPISVLHILIMSTFRAKLISKKLFLINTQKNNISENNNVWSELFYKQNFNDALFFSILFI